MADYQRVLDRVERDLARGHTYVALQRLSTLVQEHPLDPLLRERLAAVHLRTGNFVEAGRWSYLAEQRDPEAVAAFERAYRHPRARRDALRWPAATADTADPVVRARLEVLDREAAGKAARGFAPRTQRASDLIESIFAATVLLSVVAVFVIGLVTVWRWIW